MKRNKNFLQSASHFLSNIARGKILWQALTVGLIAGILVVLFKMSTGWLFRYIQAAVNGIHFWQKAVIYPVITTAGGILAGFMVYKLAPEAKGSGIPYVKICLAHMGDITRTRTIFVKFFAGLSVIGSGLSLGPEGPCVQLGAGAGSLVGKIFKTKGNDNDKLIGAGAGAAIGATFNAPIAGAIFTLEELTQNFSATLLFTTLIATVTAASVERYFMGVSPSLYMPSFIANEINWETFILCVVLGVISGFFGILFSKLIAGTQHFYDSMRKLPSWLKPGVAGLIVGIIGLFLPAVLGSGDIGINLLLQNKLTLGIAAAIFIGKFFVTPLCSSSGAAGGIFLPMIMLGVFLGYLTASLANICGLNLNPLAVSGLGMVSFLAGVARTPITAVIMVFEMTAGYSSILPLMLCAAIADFTAGRLGHKPIYEILAIEHIKKSPETEIPKNKLIKDIMSRRVKTFGDGTEIETILDWMKENRHSACPIIDENKKLVGLVTRADIEDAILSHSHGHMPANSIMNPNPVVVSRGSNLHTTYYRLHTAGTEWAVVVNENFMVRGIVTRVDILKVTNINMQKKLYLYNKNQRTDLATDTAEIIPLAHAK